MKLVKNKRAYKHWLDLLKLGVLSVLLVCLASLSACLFSDNGYPSNSDTSSSSNANTKEKLNIANVEMIVDYSSYLGYSVKITGTAKNLSGKNYSYASVEFSVYDVDGNNLGTALDNINHLANGDTWKFEANLFSYPNTRPNSYKLVEITAF